MIVKVKKLHKDAIVPEYAHATDTGFDLFSVEETTIPANGKAIVKTGLAFGLPAGWGVEVRNKSGITMKGVPTTNGTTEDITVYIGTIDTGYRGEIGIMIKNENDFGITIPKQIKVAQGVLEQIFQCGFEEVEELDDTDRGTGGYGSTGFESKGA
ncbi:dUTP diphosphatase [Romboutsia sp.]|uniref:dUTP diphosphatase n=1 Tax=Romboutsia sp. TaxID=1965302 RepID=UPI002CAEC9FB|nr:dUTP diphosphatase [Romboutsia sp.]HSQ87994.1 dUTP diphosphatase [Romboutsia sp.]